MVNPASAKTSGDRPTTTVLSHLGDLKGRQPLNRTAPKETTGPTPADTSRSTLKDAAAKTTTRDGEGDPLTCLDILLGGSFLLLQFFCWTAPKAVIYDFPVWAYQKLAPNQQAVQDASKEDVTPSTVRKETDDNQDAAAATLRKSTMEQDGDVQFRDSAQVAALGKDAERKKAETETVETDKPKAPELERVDTQTVETDEPQEKEDSKATDTAELPTDNTGDTEILPTTYQNDDAVSAFANEKTQDMNDKQKAINNALAKAKDQDEDTMFLALAIAFAVLRQCELQVKQEQSVDDEVAAAKLFDKRVGTSLVLKSGAFCAALRDGIQEYEHAIAQEDSEQGVHERFQEVVDNVRKGNFSQYETLALFPETSGE